LPLRAAIITIVWPSDTEPDGIRAGLDQRLHDLPVAVERGEQQRRDTVPVGLIRAGAGTEEQPRGLEVVAPNGPVQRCRAVNLRRIHVHGLPEQRPHQVVVAALDGRHQWRRDVAAVGRR
jgi:hypothetical protein